MAVRRERRTQEERREGTIRKLLDASTEALIEVGYTGATVQEISERAGVSHGGLFRHFATREALMVAVGEDVGKRLLDHYRREFVTLRSNEDPVLLALKLVREATRSRLNQAWYELAIAARTNKRLRKALAPVASHYYADIAELARGLLPDLAESLGEQFTVLVDTMIAVFDGEVLHRFVLEKPEVEAKRMDLLLLVTRLLSNRK